MFLGVSNTPEMIRVWGVKLKNVNFDWSRIPNLPKLKKYDSTPVRQKRKNFEKISLEKIKRQKTDFMREK